MSYILVLECSRIEVFSPLIRYILCRSRQFRFGDLRQWQCRLKRRDRVSECISGRLLSLRLNSVGIETLSASRCLGPTRIELVDLYQRRISLAEETSSGISGIRYGVSGERNARRPTPREITACFAPTLSPGGRTHGSAIESRCDRQTGGHAGK